ncbi:MAG: sodium:calcium antiporter [Rubrobacteraceae bacterium]
MPDLSGASLTLSLGLFVAAAVVIAFAGTRLTSVADTLADRTGLGEALVGALLLGGATSLSGIVTSVTAAADGNPELAISNAVGGIAAQTMFLAVADAVYRRANLEHAAASPANLAQGTLLVTLLAIPLMAYSGPQISLWSIHLATPVMIAAYIFGIRIVSQTQTEPMWGATQTPETQNEEDQDSEDAETGNLTLGGLWVRFVLFGATIGVAGWVVAKTGINIAAQTGLTETFVGGVLTAVATSLPELVTSIAAVRRGALTLAVGGIIGGNAFDTIFIAFSDVAYRGGSIYHAVTERQVFLIALTVLLTGLLLLGLLRRQKYGIANIGFESFLVMILYLGSFALLTIY